MSAISISLIAFCFVFGGALLGMLLHALLPQHHLSSETKDVVILEMSAPYTGLIQVSQAPLRAALSHLGE